MINIATYFVLTTFWKGLMTAFQRLMRRHERGRLESTVEPQNGEDAICISGLNRGLSGRGGGGFLRHHRLRDGGLGLDRVGRGLGGLAGLGLRPRARSGLGLLGLGRLARRLGPRHGLLRSLRLRTRSLVLHGFELCLGPWTSTA